MIPVLLHGFSGDGTTWAELCLHWQPDQPGVAIDLPGHGAGPAVRRGWRANLEAVREAIEVGGERLRDATIIGYSLGARVALGLVAEGLAGRAVLISVNPGLPEHEREARRRADAQWVELLRTRGTSAFADQWAKQPLFASQAHLGEEAPRRRQATRLRQSAEGLARSLEEMGLAEMPDYRPQLPSLADRLTLIAGADDLKFRALAESMVAQAPALPLHVIPSCGHDIPLEQPRLLATLLASLL